MVGIFLSKTMYNDVYMVPMLVDLMIRELPMMTIMTSKYPTLPEHFYHRIMDDEYYADNQKDYIFSKVPNCTGGLIAQAFRNVLDVRNKNGAIPNGFW